jgi:putative ABC transport system ATP-binding protein
MATPAIELVGITKEYADGAGRLPVLRGVDLTVQPGEFVAVVGPSGCGKSTLLHVAGGLDRAHGGEARVQGRSLAGLDDAALSAFRSRQIGFVFQSFNLLPSFSALENVLLPGFFGDERPDAPEAARAALAEVGLGAKVHRKPRELSGGERQRVALARALYLKPSIVLADEPTGNLDAATGAQVIELFRKLHAEHGVTLVVVTHEERVSQAASRVVRLAEGRLAEVAT